MFTTWCSLYQIKLMLLSSARFLNVNLKEINRLFLLSEFFAQMQCWLGPPCTIFWNMKEIWTIVGLLKVTIAFIARDWHNFWDGHVKRLTHFLENEIYLQSLVVCRLLTRWFLLFGNFWIIIGFCLLIYFNIIFFFSTLWKASENKSFLFSWCKQIKHWVKQVSNNQPIVISTGSPEVHPSTFIPRL